MAKIYVAGAASEIDRVEGVIAQLKASGHEITHDWTVEIRGAEAKGLTDSDLPLDARVRFAEEDLAGIDSADLYLLVAPAPGKGRGSWVELGYALGAREYTAYAEGYSEEEDRIVVVVCGPYAQDSIFTSLANHIFQTDALAVEYVNERWPVQS